MNLLTSNWLAGLKTSGARGALSPLEVGEEGWQDIIAIRPDFRGALYQFLIGVLQLAYAPEDTDEWKERYEEPPGKSELAEALKAYLPAFELDVEGPAFMQDYDLSEKVNQLSVAELLIDAGSESNLFFNKPVDEAAFCESCFAQALFTLQINAPSGGRGVRTSLRGGGPLTTLLVPEERSGDEPVSLWQRLWLNVLPREVFEGDSRTPLTIRSIGDVLPWMTKTRTSDGNNAPGTTPDCVHPWQAYWSMSRRIRIDRSTVQEQGACTLCDARKVSVIRHYLTRHGGTNYTGNWMHPLTPYRLDAKGATPPISIKGGVAGRGYREWLGLVLGKEDHQPDPALVVSHFNSSLSDVRDIGIWCFGYEMNNMKAVGWHEAVLPVHQLEPAQRSGFMLQVKRVLDVCDALADSISRQVKAARFKNPKEVKKSDPAVPESFWSASEPVFYELLRGLMALPSHEDSKVAPAFKRWWVTVRQQVLRLFDHWALSVPLEELDMKRVVKARAALQKDLMRDKAVQPILDVIHPDRKTRKKGGRHAKKIAQ